jgi:hypothetical protein
VSDGHFIQLKESGKRRRPRNSVRPRSPTLRRAIRIAPVNSDEWQEIADAVGVGVAELERLPEPANGLSWPAAVDKIIRSVVTVLESTIDGTVEREVDGNLQRIEVAAAELRRAIVTSRRETWELLRGECPDLLYALEVAYWKKFPALRFQLGDGRAQRGRWPLTSFLADVLTLAEAASDSAALPGHGEEHRAEEFPTYRLAQALIALAHSRALKVAPAAATALHRLKTRPPRTLCDRLRAARRQPRVTFLTAAR